MDIVTEMLVVTLPVVVGNIWLDNEVALNTEDAVKDRYQEWMLGMDGGCIEDV